MDVQPTGKDIHYSAVTVLFCSVDLQASAAESLPLFQDRNISFLDIQQDLQSAHLKTSIYNERKPAELKLCTEWDQTQHSFREGTESTPVTLICGWRLGNFVLYYCI
jgi:hypothetical protein